MHASSATGLACLTVLLCAGTATSAPSDQIYIDAKAVITEDQRVRTSGTYRCVDENLQEPVMVTATVRQGDNSVSGGAHRATCDGKTHAWSSESQPSERGSIKPGRATVESTLMQLEAQDGLIPPILPGFRTASVREVSLTAAQ